MQAFGCTSQKELAEFLKISAEDLSNRKRRGTLTKLIEEKAFENNIDFKWIETGVASSDGMAAVKCSAVTESLADYPAPHRISPETSYPDTLVHKTRAVLNSDSVFRRALDSNIEAFHEAVTMKERLAATEAKLAQCERCIEEMKVEIEKLKGDRAKNAV